MAPSASYYLRVGIDGTYDTSPEGRSQQIETPDARPDLTFVDLHARLHAQPSPTVSQIEILTNAVQDHLHYCSRTDLIIFRWPWIGGPDDQSHTNQIEEWIYRLTSEEAGEPVLAQHIRVGVIQHRVANDPILRWSHEEPASTDVVLCHARATEIEAMLRYKNAIWEPKDYHYSLLSGEHTDVFVRLADAIQEPQDAYVMACWLSDRLTDGCGVIVDTGGFTPLLIQLESLLGRFGFEIGPTAILPAYPTGRSTVRRTVESARSAVSNHTIGVLSVSSTGSLQSTLMDELERVAESDGIDFTLDVIVDRTSTNAPLNRFKSTDDTRLVSWVNLEREAGAEYAGSCQLCQSAEKAPVVAVDPRTYVAMTLPKPHLVMPDTKYATAGQMFWERAAQCQGRAIEVNPHPESRLARGKRAALPVRPIFELITRPDGLKETVRSRWRNLTAERREERDLIDSRRRLGVALRPQDVVRSGEKELDEALKSTALVVAASRDVAEVPIPAFAGYGSVNLEHSLRQVLKGIGLDGDLPIITTENPTALQEHIARLRRDESVLVFSWGSVTGLTLRHLKLAVADALRHISSDSNVNALVFHARVSSPSEWEAQQNQFRPNLLECLWSSCFPWDSPLGDESRLLDLPEIVGSSTSDAATRFLEQRHQFLAMHSTYADMEDDWSPRFNLSDQDAHPEHIFWGMSRYDVHQQKVRGRSLYGKNLDCLTAYAALGSVITYTRLKAEPRAAPRWVMFDMGRLVRSYFDAVIICSVLRWLQPGELWWGERDDRGSIRDSVSFLIDQAEHHEEQVLLVPELVLASAQGKVPRHTHDIIHEWALATSASWPNSVSFDNARGAVEIGLRLLEMG